MELSPRLLGACIVDNAVLSNFVYAGAAPLLAHLAGEPLRIGPTVLDEAEAATVLLPGMHFTSEALRVVARISEPDAQHLDLPYLQTFVAARGTLWLPAAPTIDELAIAERLRSPQVTAQAKQRCGLTGRLKIDAGEAEAVAIALSRGWTFLTDDRAAVEVISCLFPEIKTLRSCALLCLAAERQLISCSEAARLFNEVMVDQLHAHASRRKGTERLYLRCDPPKCHWEATN